MTMTMTISVLTAVFCCVGFLRTELELNKQKKRINAIETVVGTNPPSKDPRLSENTPGKFYSVTRTGYIVSCNLIGSDAEPKHWLDRERTKFQIDFLVEEKNACRITVKINLSTDKSRRFYSSKDSIHRYQDAEGPGIFLYRRYAGDQCS